MSKVLIVTSNYWPEPTGIAVYTFDLARTLVRKGHDVTVMTGLPHYPWWNVPAQFSHLKEGHESQDGIKVGRANHYVPAKVNTKNRIRFELSLWRNFGRVTKKFSKKEFDLVISFIPSLAAGIIGHRISRNINAIFGLVVQDLTGIGVSQSGLRGAQLISTIATRIEKSILFAAAKIVVISPEMQEIVIGQGIEESKIDLIRNYSARIILPLQKTVSRIKFGWSEKCFLVIHSGNIGNKQDLGNVVKAAEHLRHFERIRFLIVGHGNQEHKIKELCKDSPNVSLIPAVSNEDYPRLLASADLLLVNERSTQTKMSLPSKLSSYLYSNRPILAAVPRYGATWNFLDGIAELVESDNPKRLAHSVLELSKNPKKRIDLAKKGLVFAKSNLNPEKGRAEYLDWVESLVQSKRA